MADINMRISVEKKKAHYRILVRDEKTNTSKSFPIYDCKDKTIEEIIERLKKCILDW
jgi:hypothetical protein